jgi:hypothetical protein
MLEQWQCCSAAMTRSVDSLSGTGTVDARKQIRLRGECQMDGSRQVCRLHENLPGVCE